MILSPRQKNPSRPCAKPWARTALPLHFTLLNSSPREYNSTFMNNLAPRASAPEDLIEMMERTVTVLKRKCTDIDLTDRKQAVKVWGGLWLIMVDWTLVGKDAPAYKQKEDDFYPNEASAEATQWVHGTTSDRQHTLMRKAFKSKWPEASEWMLKHEMGN